MINENEDKYVQDIETVYVNDIELQDALNALFAYSNQENSQNG